MSTDPRSYERAVEHEATRPHPLPSVRHTGKPVGRMISDALGLTDPEPVESTCVRHGNVPYEHTCRAPGESAAEFSARCFGEMRDV